MAMTDQDHVARIRTAANELNSAIADAWGDGLAIDLQATNELRSFGKREGMPKVEVSVSRPLA